MSELKPCPFCGSPAYSYHDNCIDFAGVKCDLGGCVCADILITENNWNTRPIEDNLIARIAELKAAQRWIPVSERLPEATGDYIVTCDGWSNSEIAYWNFPDSDNPSGWLEYMQYIWSRKPVKYWMPLPKPPEVQE